jgi:DNA-binding beta-propeller fold protein YncE
MRAVLPLLTALALLAGCSSRERANPLDPANPETGGRPPGFNAIAGHDIVLLSWTPHPELAIDGFRVMRLAPGDSVYRPIAGALSPTTSRCNDLLVADGATYRYRLYYIIQGSPGHLPAEDVATPGPLRPWVADYGSGSLLRLSPDGRDVIAGYSDAGDVQSLAVDPADGRVWTSASTDGIVSTRLPGDPVPVVIPGLGRPYSLAVSPLDHGAWVCNLNGSLAHFSTDGGRIAYLTNLVNPTGVAVSPRDYSVWVCEKDGDRARHLNSAGTLIATARVPAATRVAVDSLSGQAWITSYEGGRVWRVSALGALLDSSSAAAGPIGIAVDARRGRAWIADALGDRVLALELATMRVLVTVTGLPEAGDLDVDLATGEVWVVARASQEIVRLSRDGVVLQRLGGFSDPSAVRLDPGQ